MTYMTKIVNLETGEEIEREMNKKEALQFEADVKEAEDRKVKEDAELEAAAIAKAALLERLGITEEEAKLLLA